MAPYRSAREQRAAPAAPENGLVAEMVRQFADPYAFLRELVQNGMDAGARRIAARVELMPGGICATSVQDDGGGMSREVIEGPLLTLFSSSKEGDSGKIGKYGVGFVSVFALEPEAVEVETWRDGQAWLLRLRPDHSYELEDAGKREGSGTRVTLLQPMDGEAFPGHAGRVRASLRRWCRHAQCEIELRVVDLEAPGDAGAAGERIDVPLAVQAAVSVTISDEELTIVVGPAAGTGPSDAQGNPAPELSQSFAGFYNRGLTLYETTDEVLGGLEGVRFKAMSKRFQHTLSRDNVRRDEAFKEALGRVREAVKGPLKKELARRLWPAAAEAAEGRGLDAYAAMLEAALTAPTEIDRDEIPFPLAHPIDGALARADLKGVVPWGESLLVAVTGDALTEAVAASGRPVVLCKRPAIRALLSRCYPRARIANARGEFTLVRGLREAAEAAEDRALLEATAEALSRAGREVARIALCRVLGAQAKRSALLIEDSGAGPWLCAGIEIDRRAAKWRATDALHLNVQSDAVARARHVAGRDPVAAGALLARSLLVEARGPLDAGESDRLLDLGRAGAVRPGKGARS